MFKGLQIMCAKYYKHRCMFKKIHLVNVIAISLIIASKLALFSVSGLKDEKLIKSKPT